MVSSSIYTVGGAVQAGKNAVYLSRRTDEELLELCRPYLSPGV